MADRSAIEWTDATWNPVRGCTRVSTGCGGPNHEGGCYAEKIAARFSDPGQPFHGFAERTPHGGRWTGRVELIESALTLPLRWKKPRRIFVNSMSDLFHEALPDAAIDRVFAVMALAPQHTFQVLTKRPARMRSYVSMARAHPVGLAALELTLQHAAIDPRSDVGSGVMLQGDIAHLKAWPLPNLWLGTSVEDQPAADERIPELLAAPASVRFISAEPLLGPTVIRPHWLIRHHPGSARIDWVIVGGESGPNARPMHPDWARILRDQCEAGGVPFFFKQWGEWLEFDHGSDDYEVEAGSEHAASILPLLKHPGWITRDGRFFARQKDLPADETPCRLMDRVGKKAAGNLLDGRTWQEFPR